jgi:translocator protein
MALWVGQMLMNWLWSPVWFTWHLLWPAFAVIVLLWILIAAFIVTTRRRDPISAALFLPYLLWVSFAGVLNLSIAMLNN